MKRILTMLIMLTPFLMLNAQAPEGVNYQAVARDAGGDVLTNETLDVRVSINESSASGTTVYEETHTATTNDFGLFSLVIGDGTVVSGTFANIDWASDSHYLKVDVDDGTGYVSLGTTQFVSVPYALYAKEAGSAGGGSVWSTDGSIAYYEDGNVGIGIDSPNTNLVVEGTEPTVKIGQSDFNQTELVTLGLTENVNEDYTCGFNFEMNPDHNTLVLAGICHDTNPPDTVLWANRAGNASIPNTLALGTPEFNDSYALHVAGDSSAFTLVDDSRRLTVKAHGNEPSIIPYGPFAENGRLGENDHPFWQIHSDFFYAEASGNYQTFSDSRIKENVNPLEHPVDKLMAINGVSYDIKESHFTRSGKSRNPEARYNQIGLVAQDVEQIFPQLVQTHQESGLKTVGYMGLIPVMVEAIKAQQQQIDQLEAENQSTTELEQRYEHLKDQYERLEQRLESVESGQ